MQKKWQEQAYLTPRRRKERRGRNACQASGVTYAKGTYLCPVGQQTRSLDGLPAAPHVHLLPTTFHFRSMTHLAVLPHHAFVQLLLPPGTEAPNRCHLPTHSPHPVCCALPTGQFPHTLTTCLHFTPTADTPLFYRPLNPVPGRTPQRVQEWGYYGAQEPTEATRPAPDLPLPLRTTQRSAVSCNPLRKPVGVKNDPRCQKAAQEGAMRLIHNRSIASISQNKVLRMIVGFPFSPLLTKRLSHSTIHIFRASED